MNDKGEIVTEISQDQPWVPIEGGIPATAPRLDGPKGSEVSPDICDEANYPEICADRA